MRRPRQQPRPSRSPTRRRRGGLRACFWPADVTPQEVPEVAPNEPAAAELADGRDRDVAGDRDAGVETEDTEAIDQSADEDAASEPAVPIAAVRRHEFGRLFVKLRQG